MPATEETYRPQPILHLVFAISSIAMLLSIAWMVAADHLRPWKEVQREFQTIERKKLDPNLAYGVIVAESPALTLIHQEIDFQFDGYMAARTKGITQR